MFGSKADNLIKLKAAGLNVPDFEVVEAGEEYSRERCLAHRGRVAVRSCCNLEDGAQESFAGQFPTFLDVAPADIADRIEACRQGVDAPHVAAYLNSRGLASSDLSMCVIVQDMVHAEVSGVLFTANPQGILNESVIVCGRGSGEGVVSDAVDVTSYYYHLTDRRYYFEGKEDLLSSEQIEELIEVSERVKALLGDYLDIEFSIEEGVLYLLQARPITTLTGASPLVLDNSNIVESYPGLSRPLTISFVEMAYRGVFRGLCARVLKNDAELRKYSDVFGNMVGHANGRMYYKISNWYALLQVLPFHKRIIPVWQEMLGVRNRAQGDRRLALNPLVRMMTYFHVFYELATVPRHMKRLEESFVRVNERFYDRFDPAMDLGEMKALYDEVREKLLDVWDVTLLNDLYAFLFTGLLKNRLRKKFGYDDEAVNRCIGGISDIESMKPVKALIALARCKDEVSREEFERRKAEYIRSFGDRNLEELKLESRTFRTTPALLDERIEEYRRDMKKLNRMCEELDASRSVQPPQDFLTRFLAKRCAAGIAGRESSRLNRSRIYGIVRLLFDSMGERFAAEGLLETASDVYYLQLEELFSMIEGPCDRRELVAERKQDYALYETLPAYTRLIFEEKEFDKHHSLARRGGQSLSKNILQGIPCSSGEAEGEALVISGPQDAHDVGDKILITRMTDPGWVFLLASAKGIVSEKGSLLSHTAIIARELGVPSVVGVEQATEAIRTGDRIRIDGGTGRIEIIGRTPWTS